MKQCKEMVKNSVYFCEIFCSCVALDSIFVAAVLERS